MRHVIFILTIFVILGCKSSSTTSESLLRENLEQKLSDGKDSIATRKYISDSSYLNYDFQTDLKNGYRLEYRVYVESDYSDTLQTIFLMKGSNEIKDLNGGSSLGFLHKNIGYIGADFDSSFVFVQSFGSGNPHYIQLIEKKTGNEIRKGTWVDADENEQVMLYIENEHEQNEKLLIYDVKNDNEIISTGFEKSKCVEQAIGGIRNCVKIDTVTTNEIILKIENDEERIIKKYNR